ncbi:transmembrane 7 superfamily member 3 isoform X4 [Perognathus longimembris pacificus]|uniref:transmembrane 7 superfamily member 3 isoform X4 n=1 Tax=Perognathus longimembris pacificus TaxID=214514 RepID=UPI002019A60D|nr:transmembrane 7 superfamily member 3 isoform X4 [Perognathus longimembris pacificus]
MQVLWLLILAVLVAQRGTTSVAEVFGNASTGLLEFSVGKFRYFELNRLFPKEAILHHISTNVTFLLFQIHSQYQNTTLSFSKTILPNTSGTGSDRGLVFILRPEQTVCTWHLETLEEKPVYNMAIPLSYSERDPVPGGCNLEFDLDIDPNIYLEYNFFEMRIKFAPANVGFARGVVPPPCDTEEGQDFRWRLQYDVYQYFLPENDLTEDALLQHLQRMAQVPQVRANAVKVVTLTANDKTEVSFSSLLGQGVIYNVIVWDPFFNTYAAYVPVHTYACSFEAVEGSCASLGNLKVFRDDGVFWMTFSCIAILIPVVFMGCLRILNILTCGIIGSYSVVLAIGSYVFTSLSSITVNVLRRALDANFNKAFTSVPFQTNDFVVLAIWGMLAVSGITLQIRRERGQPFFPPHPYKLWKQERERRVTNILDPSHHILPLRNRLWDQFTRIREFFQKPQPAGERTPLLL